MKSFLKKIENVNRIILYSIIKIFFRNKRIAIPVDTSTIKKILIFRYDVIGDMIVTTPVFDLLRRELPEARIDVYCSSRNYAIIKSNPRVDNIYIYEQNFLKRLFQTLKMRKNAYDIIFAFVFHKTTKAGILANLIGTKQTIKVTLGNEKRNNLYSVFFNVLLILENRGYMTMTECLIKIVSDLLGCEYKVTEGKLEISTEHKNIKFAENFICELNSQFENIQRKIFLLYNISARRKWGNRENIEFISLLLHKFHNMVILLSYAPEDYVFAEQIKNKFNHDKNVITLPQGLDILDVSAIIKKVDLVFTPDTSLVHIADVYKKPVFIIYSKQGSYVKEWMPFQTQYSAIISYSEDSNLSDISPQRCFDEFSAFVNKMNLGK